MRPSVIVGAGVVAALNFGKLPPAIPALQAEFGLSLVLVSWMVSLFMFGSALFGIAGGSIADRFDLRRVMVSGLLLMGASSAAGALASSPAALFTSRAVESLGFLLTVLPGPALLRACVPAQSVRGWLGFWGAYMPAGMSAALIATPWLMAAGGWRAAWWVVTAMALLWAALIGGARWRPAPGSAGAATGQSPSADAGSTKSRLVSAPSRPASLARNALETARAPGPWLLASCFAFYAGQFLGVFSFLPSIYGEAGIAKELGALLTALAVMANVSGNMLSGLLLQRGFQRQTLIAFAGLTMAAMAWLAFGSGAGFGLRYSAVVVLSAVGGLIPGTLFATAPFYAPSQSAVSTTVGLMQQGSGLGQILLPPVVAALAQYTGDWSSTWIATGSAAMATVAIAAAIARFDRVRLRRG